MSVRSLPDLNVSEPAIARLAGGVQGRLPRPGDDGFDAARRVSNAAIDRHPAPILRCDDTADVARGVTFAREHGLASRSRAAGTMSPARPSATAG